MKGRCLDSPSALSQCVPHWPRSAPKQQPPLLREALLGVEKRVRLQATSTLVANDLGHCPLGYKFGVHIVCSCSHFLVFIHIYCCCCCCCCCCYCCRCCCCCYIYYSLLLIFTYPRLLKGINICVSCFTGLDDWHEFVSHFGDHCARNGMSVVAIDTEARGIKGAPPNGKLLLAQIRFRVHASSCLALCGPC